MRSCVLIRPQTLVRKLKCTPEHCFGWQGQSALQSDPRAPKATPYDPSLSQSLSRAKSPLNGHRKAWIGAEHLGLPSNSRYRPPFVSISSSLVFSYPRGTDASSLRRFLCPNQHVHHRPSLSSTSAIALLSLTLPGCATRGTDAAHSTEHAGVLRADNHGQWRRPPLSSSSSISSTASGGKRER